jgi:predicted nucleotidyltransferase
MVYTLDDIKARITPVAEKYKLPAVYIFGSYARGDADEKSDVDIMIDCNGTTIDDLFAFNGVFLDFKDNFEKEIDILDYDVLDETNDVVFADNVKRDMVRVYAR